MEPIGVQCAFSTVERAFEEVGVDLSTAPVTAMRGKTFDAVRDNLLSKQGNTAPHDDQVHLRAWYKSELKFVGAKKITPNHQPSTLTSNPNP